MEQTILDRVRRHVDRLAGLIGPRHLGVPIALEAAATLIERELIATGLRPWRESYLVNNHPVANIVAEVPGRQGELPILILGAHYDTVFTTPGADDNASAVAVLLEVARLLPRDLRRSVRFVAFACEEPPYFHTGEMGSQVHARHCRQRQEQIRGMICLEMVGYFSDEPHSQQYPPAIQKTLGYLLPRRGNFLGAVGNLRSLSLLWNFRRGFSRSCKLPLWALPLPESIPEIRLSDHSSFWDQGYPALMVTDTSFFRNPHYHLSTDTPDTLDYAALVKVVQGIAGAVSYLAR